MRETMRPGISRTETVHVGPDRAIAFMGEAMRVYSTPDFGRDVETACRNLLLEHSDQGEDSVGVRMELDHAAATPIGMDVTVTVTLAAREGRRATFDFVARDAIEEIGRGRHIRFVVDVETAKQRLAAKVAKAAAIARGEAA